MVREVNAAGLGGSRRTLWDSLLLLACLGDLRRTFYFVAATSRGGSNDAFKMSTALR
jgi:hypothetical protein